MKTWKKVAIGVGCALLLLAIGSFIVYQSRKGVAKVQTGKVAQGYLTATVSGSGEINPEP